MYKYFKQKKVGGCLYLIFGFSGVNDSDETDFGDFRSDYLGENMPYAKRFKPVNQRHILG
jgi:hypothetical protein